MPGLTAQTPPQQSPKRGEVIQGLLSFLLILRRDQGGYQLKAMGGLIALPSPPPPRSYAASSLSSER